MGLLMDYCSYNNDTFEKSINAFKNGEAKENWSETEAEFGDKKASVKIDKSWNFLSILFEKSEIGNFIIGNENESKFELEEIAVCIFSNSYLKTVCDFAQEKILWDRETFLNIAKSHSEFDNSKGEYYHENLVKLLDFYSLSSQNKNWVLGLLM